jgi:hypothetical protein
VKALTVRRPYAFLIVAGVKLIENRTWPLRHRGPLLIHAGKGVDREALERFGHLLPVAPFPAGALIGVVSVDDCRRVGDAPATPFTTGPWCWLLSDPRPLRRPLPWRGLPGLFDVPDSVLRRVLTAGDPRR